MAFLNYSEFFFLVWLEESNGDNSVMHSGTTDSPVLIAVTSFTCSISAGDASIIFTANEHENVGAVVSYVLSSIFPDVR